MNINELSKEELVALKSDINSRIKHIDKIKKEINTKDKNILRDLIDCDNPKIFCIRFSGSNIHTIDYIDIKITQSHYNDEIFRFDLSGKNCGFSSTISLDTLDSHCFIVEGGYDNIMFLSLKPEKWYPDLIIEKEKLISEKEKYFSGVVDGYKKSITGLLECDKVDIFLENIKKKIKSDDENK